MVHIYTSLSMWKPFYVEYIEIWHSPLSRSDYVVEHIEPSTLCCVCISSVLLLLLLVVDYMYATRYMCLPVCEYICRVVRRILSLGYCSIYFSSKRVKRAKTNCKQQEQDNNNMWPFFGAHCKQQCPQKRLANVGWPIFHPIHTLCDSRSRASSSSLSSWSSVAIDFVAAAAAAVIIIITTTINKWFFWFVAINAVAVIIITIN